jgi:C4-dicarboxylate transporter, DctM subunit
LRIFGRLETWIASLALAAMVVLPLAEILARQIFKIGIPGSGTFVQHLTLWVGFLGAAIAAREGRLLTLATTEYMPKGFWRRTAHTVSSIVAAGITALLTLAALQLVLVERDAGTMVAMIPTWIAQLVLPISFALIALRLVWRAGDTWVPRALAALGLVAGIVLGQYPQVMETIPSWPGLLIVLVGSAFGGPIFTMLGGVAVLLFMKDGVPIAAMPVETYRLAVSPTLAAIPLFTLTGYLLSESKSSERLVAVFRAFFGWFPGGTAVVVAVVCAFFTAFTGGSGVTILALGALLYQALQQDRYRDRFSLGLLTACGSLGLLFPPSLPLILYGIVAQVPIEDLFIGGVLPGVLLLGMVAFWGAREGVITGAGRQAFRWDEAVRSLRGAAFELLMPVVVLIAIFGGFATIVEASALTALYAFVIQVFVKRDLSLTRDIPRVLEHSVLLIGGVLVILGVAMGLSSYMVDAQIPARLVEWTRERVHSPLMFLLALNVFLLIVGCLLDIFSAIVVVVPLIVPLGIAFGIHPVHLGIIFIANLELGYLTPPVGLNLFLSSYRFHKPVLEVARASLPMLLILAIGVLLITYLPWMTTGMLTLLGR